MIAISERENGDKCGIVKESAPDEISAEMLSLLSSMDDQTKEIMLIQMRALVKRGALNILPIEKLIFFRFDASHSSDSMPHILPIQS